MRFNEQVHWSEGLFLQPHHLQRMQHNLGSLTHRLREQLLPFAYGFDELELDEEALKSRRIVIKKFSAVMPDGSELSMPGNCNVEPLTLSFDANNESAVTVYLVLPFWTELEPNLGEQKGFKGRYVLREISVSDENTSQNEIPMMVRRYNVSLTTDIENARNCTVIPLCRVNWTVINASMPALSRDKTFIPPFITLSKDCEILSQAGELLFQMRSARNTILSEFENSGFDEDDYSPRQGFLLLRLQLLNSYIAVFESKLVPERITPYELFNDSVALLAALQAHQPVTKFDEMPRYDHDNLQAVFNAVFGRIRAIILKGGLSSALSFAFTDDPLGYLKLDITDDRVFTAPESYLAISYGGNLRDRVADIQEGDNFRLIDKDSFNARIRGVKLEEVRFLPHYLPQLSNTIWFKLKHEDQDRAWQFIAQSRSMIIDCARELFPNLKATLYVNVENK